MKCESCGNDLIGGAIICRACNHDNATRRGVAPRRAAARRDRTNPRAGGPPVESPKIVPRKDADVNLLHFPIASVRQTSSARQTAAESEPPASAYPPWRAELKERIRRIREKRASGEFEAPSAPPVQPPRAQAGEAKPDHSLIVESALKRIRWASHVPAITTAVETEGRRDKKTERQSDKAAERQSGKAAERQSGRGDRVAAATERHGDATQILPVSPPPRLSVPPPRRLTASSSLRPLISLARPEPEVKPATLYSRLMVGVCDFVIVLLAFPLILVSYAASNGGASFGKESGLPMALLLIAIVFIYQIVMLGVAGRTFGMALLDLNLVNANDEHMPVTGLQKTLRASTATIAFICFPLLLIAAFIASRRTLPDLISGTTVVRYGQFSAANHRE